jgi:SAM-dependent methyltransferase
LGGAYVGIDYSAVMVERGRLAYPDADLRQADARSMSGLDADLAFFSFNGLDAMNHQDRLHSLSEIGRVLRPGGCLHLFFSQSK